ncbi:MAG: carboxypeptidase regulatory-like domain-containing protein [Planctomycetes bacterium]|nr:carboxypeptidase regulatory-like domain-containing protein [Planctomycetota bacterium]
MMRKDEVLRLWIGAGVALLALVAGAFIAFGAGEEHGDQPAATLETEAERTSRESWLAAQGRGQKLSSGAGQSVSGERMTRTAEQGAGIVLAPDGTPVPGAKLVLFLRPATPPQAAPPERPFLYSMPEAAPPSSGEFVSLAPAGESRVHLSFALTDLVDESEKRSKARVGLGGWKLSASEMAASAAPALPQWTVARTWTADAEGRFVLEELPEGELLLDAHDGQRTLAAPLTRGEIESAPPSGLRLALVVGHFVEGLVRDSAGLPLAGVEVSCRAAAWEDGRIDPLAQRTTVTDAVGAYRISGLRFGARYQLGFAREHYFSAAEPDLLEVRRDEKLDHVLTEHATLAGTVQEGGVPLAEVEVELRGFGVEKSDASGRFRFRPRLEANRTLELFARSADRRFFGYLGVELDVAAKREDIALRLERACVVRGRVVDETGRGVGGAMVALQWEERTNEHLENRGIAWGNAKGGSGRVFLGDFARVLQSRVGQSASFRVQLSSPVITLGRPAQEPSTSVITYEAPAVSLSMDSDGKLVDFLSGLSFVDDGSGGAAGIFEARRTAEADAEGRYEFLGVWPGRYRVSASHPEHLAGEDRECAMAPGDEREVDLVLPRGAKVAGTVFDLEGRPAENATVIAVRAGDEQQRTQTDASGRFAMVGLSPGELDLVANAEEGGNAALRGLSLANGSDIGELVLRLGAGAGLFGRIVDGMGAPIAGATVTLSSKLASSSQHQVESGADGSYRIERALHGEHTLHVQAAGYLPFELDGLLLDGMLRRDVTLERGATLSGTIYGPDGAPLAGAPIFLFHGDAEDTSLADDAGRFRFEGLRPGTLQVYVRAEDYSGSARASRELALGENIEGFDLRLRPSGVVRGIVRDAAGKPVAGVEVNGVTEPGGKGRREATTGSDGRFEMRRLYPDHYRIYAGSDPNQGIVIDARAGGELAEIELVNAR